MSFRDGHISYHQFQYVYQGQCSRYYLLYLNYLDLYRRYILYPMLRPSGKECLPMQDTRSNLVRKIPGEGNGKWYSCLEIPWIRGAWGVRDYATANHINTLFEEH